MFAKIIGVIVLVSPISYAFVHDQDLPTFAKCDEKVVSGIQTYWKTSGTPSNVLKKMEDAGRFVAVHTSYDYKNSENKCVFMDASDKNKTLKFTFTRKDGSTPGVLSYKVKESEDGSIYDEEKNMRWYTTALTQGVEVNYVCSVTGEYQIATLGSIFVAENKFSSLVQPVVATFSEFLTGLGVNFKYNYGAECFGENAGGGLGSSFGDLGNLGGSL